MSNRVERINAELKRFLRVLGANEEDIGFYLQIAVQTYNQMSMKAHGLKSPHEIMLYLNDTDTEYTDEHKFSETNNCKNMKIWVLYRKVNV